MTQTARNVLDVNPAKETERYRRAVAQILVNIQQSHDVTLKDIAEDIGVSLGTISNAANRNCDLGSTYLKRLGEAYGPEVLDPYVALAGGRIVPLQPKEMDALPSLTSVVHLIAQSRSPNSVGGERITHTQLLDMLPALKDAQAAITNLIIKAERFAA